MKWNEIPQEKSNSSNPKLDRANHNRSPLALLDSKKRATKYKNIFTSPLGIGVGVVVVVVLIVVGLSGMSQKANKNVASQSNNSPAENQQGVAAAQWGSSTSGILALTSGTMELLSPTTGKVISTVTLPTSNSLTDNGNGRQFTLQTTDSTIDNYDFNRDARYIPVQFAQASDDSQDVGYYDVTNGRVTDVSNNVTGTSFGAKPTVDSSPVFDQTNPNILYFCRNGCGGGGNTDIANYSYNLLTRNISPANYTEEQYCQPPQVNESGTCELPGQVATAGTGLTSDGGSLAMDKPAGSGNYTDFESASSGDNVSCSPVRWLNTATLLCNSDSSNGDFDFLEVNLSSLTSSGNNFIASYTVPQPTDNFLPSNDRTNQYAVFSPDNKTMAFVSTLGNDTGLYTVSSTGGQPKRISTIASDTQLIEWN